MITTEDPTEKMRKTKHAPTRRLRLVFQHELIQGSVEEKTEVLSQQVTHSLDILTIRVQRQILEIDHAYQSIGQ